MKGELEENARIALSGMTQRWKKSSGLIQLQWSFARGNLF